MLVRSRQVSPVLGEIFAMLVLLVIIFLMIYSIDLDREKDAHKLEQGDGNRG
jgi:hypothetical protein